MEQSGVVGLSISGEASASRIPRRTVKIGRHHLTNLTVLDTGMPA